MRAQHDCGRADRCHTRNSAAPPYASTCPHATPAMPRRGSGPRPRPSAAPSTICATDVTRIVADGVRMSPLPRSTDTSEFASHTVTMPPNSTSEYASACSTTASLPPSSRYRPGPKAMNNTLNARPAAMPISAACNASARARSASPAPSARLIADEMPPPIEPAENICISITNGNTSAIAASGCMPSRPMYIVSAMLVDAAAAIASTLGSASRSRVGRMRPSSIACRGRGSVAVVAVDMRHACLSITRAPRRVLRRAALARGRRSFDATRSPTAAAPAIRSRCRARPGTRRA